MSQQRITRDNKNRAAQETRLTKKARKVVEVNSLKSNSLLASLYESASGKKASDELRGELVTGPKRLKTLKKAL